MPRTRPAGFAIVLVSTVLWSTAGLFVRMADLDTWSVVAWRSVFAALALGLFWAAATRDKAGALRAVLSPPGVAAVAISVVGAISYIVSLQLTSVANVMTVYAALPFVAAAIAFFVLRERVTARFVTCGLVASAGVAIMSRAAVGLNDLLGIGASLVMTAGFAASLVQAKRHPSLDTTLVTVVSALVCAAVALPLMRDFAPEPRQLLACALLGAVASGLANVLSLAGGRLIRSGEAAFLLLLDVALGPLWVWLAFGERVGTSALIGGCIVMAAVTWYLLRPSKPEPAPIPP